MIITLEQLVRQHVGAWKVYFEASSQQPDELWPTFGALCEWLKERDKMATKFFDGIETGKYKIEHGEGDLMIINRLGTDRGLVLKGVAAEDFLNEVDYIMFSEEYSGNEKSQKEALDELCDSLNF